MAVTEVSARYAFTNTICLVTYIFTLHLGSNFATSHISTIDDFMERKSAMWPSALDTLIRYIRKFSLLLDKDGIKKHNRALQTR